MSDSPRRGFVDLLQEFSIPLLSGIAAAMLAANVDPDGYQRIVHWRPFGELALFGHALDLHYLVNDMFMVFFFGIAAKEITEACLPGGDLNPPGEGDESADRDDRRRGRPGRGVLRGARAAVRVRRLRARPRRLDRARARLGRPDRHRHRAGLARRAHRVRPRPPRDQLPAAARGGRRRRSASRSSRCSTAIPRIPRSPPSSRSSRSGWRSRSRCGGSA